MEKRCLNRAVGSVASCRVLREEKQPIETTLAFRESFPNKSSLLKEDIECRKALSFLFKYPKYVTKEHTLHFNGKKIQVYNIL